MGPIFNLAMAPVKRIQSLSLLSKNAVMTSLDEAFINLDVDKDESEHINELKKYFEGVPATILESLASEMLNYKRAEGLKYEMIQKTDKVMAERIRQLKQKKEHIAIVSFTMQVLTNSQTRSLNFSLQKFNPGASGRMHGIMITKSLIKLENLRQLTLNPVFSDGSLEIIGLNCRKLTELKLEDNKQVTDKGYHWILPRAGNDVNEMCIKHRCNVWEHGCPDLVSLDIKDGIEVVMPSSSYENKIELVKYFKKLKYFSVSMYDGRKLLKVKNQIFPVLQSLEIYNGDCQIDGRLLSKVFPNLKSIRGNLKSQILDDLVRCPQLEQIDFNIPPLNMCATFCCFDEQDEPVELTNFVNNHLNANHFKKIVFSIELEPAQLHAIGTKCPNIEHFSFRVSNSFNVKFFKEDGDRGWFTKLKFLSVKVNCTRYGRKSKFAKLFDLVLAHAKDIEMLNIEFFEDKNVKFPFDIYLPDLLERNPLNRLQTLTFIDAGGAKISLEVLKTISDLPNLTHLKFKPYWKLFTVQDFALLLVHGLNNNYDLFYELMELEEEDGDSDYTPWPCETQEEKNVS